MSRKLSDILNREPGESNVVRLPSPPVSPPPTEPPSQSASAVTSPPASQLITGLASPPAQRVSLDSTHTNSEKAVYSILYRETISLGRNDIYFRMRDLLKETGIRSKQTVRTAVHGLEGKLSIDFRFREGDVYGGVYHIYGPKEIFAARKRAGIEIDPTSKRVKFRWASPLNTESASGPVTETAGQHEIQSASPPEISPHEYNTKNNLPVTPPSSAPDDDKLARVRKLFEQLSNGGQWQSRDDETYRQIKHIPLWHIVMGLALSVTKSPEHKMQTLAYAVPQIEEHFKQMAIFPEEQMMMLAYNQMRKTLLCISTGKWTIKEFEL